MAINGCANRGSQDGNPVLSASSIILSFQGDDRVVDYKEIDYLGTNVKVSKYGDIIWNGKKRNPYCNADGYSVCSIKIPNKGWRSVSVARLVALAYIPNPENLPEVNHKDFNRTNANVDNLEWVSRKDNVVYSLCNRPNYYGENNPNYGNYKLSKIYANNKQYAVEKQGRVGLCNGRCRKISIYQDGALIKTFDYILDCCRYIQEHYSPNVKNIESIRGRIDASIRNNKKYKG